LNGKVKKHPEYLCAKFKILTINDFNSLIRRQAIAILIEYSLLVSKNSIKEITKVQLWSNA
jgi:hypothetical protein